MPSMQPCAGTNGLSLSPFFNVLSLPPFDVPEAIVVGFSLMVKFALCKDVFGGAKVGVDSRDCSAMPCSV